jgi:hypothetical protein
MIIDFLTAPLLKNTVSHKAQRHKIEKSKAFSLVPLNLCGQNQFL